MPAGVRVGDLFRAALAREDSGAVLDLFLRAIVWSTLLAFVAIAASVYLPSLFTNSDRTERDLWAACVALALLFEGLRRLVRGELGPNQLLTIAAGLGLIAVVRQITAPNWDYRCYVDAGTVAGAGGDVYAWAHGAPTLSGTRYLYSPLLANVFALLQRIPARAADELTFVVWTAIVYWAACAFVPLLLTVLHQVYGLTWRVAAAAAFLLGTLSTPALRTIQYSQPNALIADCLFAWLLLSRGRGRPAGGVSLLALASILKTSPVIFFSLLVAERRWRAVVAGVAWCFGIVALSIASIGLRPWAAFLHAAPLVRSFGYVRDNSFESVILGTGRLLGLESPDLAHLAGLLLAVVVLVAFAVRSKLAWPWTARMPEPDGAIARHFPAVLLAMCLLSPLLWEHHWVWAALPCVLLTSAAIERGGGMMSAVGTLLVFFVPTFDAYPLGYHRLAGALLVMAEALPRHAQAKVPA